MPSTALRYVLQTVLKPFRLLIESIGLLLVRLGVIDRARAKRASDLAWPRIVTGLARMSKSTVDIAMVGAAVGAPAIAGVGLATPYWVLAFMIGGGIAGGTISLVSQNVGGGDRDTVSVAVKVSAVFAVVTTLPLAVLFWSMPEPLLRLIGAEGEVLALGAQYLQVTSLAMPFAALNLVASRTLVGANNAWTPMVIRTGGAVANLVLNAVLIFGLGLGVVGAALGTVLANVAVTTVFASALLRGRLPFLGELPVRVRWTVSHWNGKIARNLATIATPLALTNIAQMGAQFPLLAIVSLFGPDVVAAFVIALRLRDLMNTPGWGFGLASSSLVGQALGQNREGEAGAYGPRRAALLSGRVRARRHRRVCLRRTDQSSLRRSGGIAGYDPAHSRHVRERRLLGPPQRSHRSTPRRRRHALAVLRADDRPRCLRAAAGLPGGDDDAGPVWAVPRPRLGDGRAGRHHLRPLPHRCVEGHQPSLPADGVTHCRKTKAPLKCLVLLDALDRVPDVELGLGRYDE